MSFRCDNCHKAVLGSPTIKVTKTRSKEYRYKDKDGKDKVSYGWEIVKEKALCKSCI